MLLSDLLDARVLDADGRALGFVVDVRLVLDAPPGGLDGAAPLATPRVHALLVSPRTGTSFLGYERTSTNAPALVARYLRHRHRGTFLVHWTDVAAPTASTITLRPTWTPWSPTLPLPLP